MIISPGARDPKVAINSANFNMASGRVVSRGRTGLGDEDDTLQFETSDGIVVVPAFDKMGLREELVRGIYAYGEPISRPRLVTWRRAFTPGFEKPSAIQQRAMRPIIQQRDVIAQYEKNGVTIVTAAWDYGCLFAGPNLAREKRRHSQSPPYRQSTCNFAKRKC